jgi:hypothetical protein
MLDAKHRSAAHLRARVGRGWRLTVLGGCVVVGLGMAMVAFGGRTEHAFQAAAAVRAQNPLTSLVREAADVSPLIGRVEERIRAGSYAYLAVRDEAGTATHWAVTLGQGAPPGTRVRVRSFGRRKEFYSPRLKRTFPELVFGMVSQLD